MERSEKRASAVAGLRDSPQAGAIAARLLRRLRPILLPLACALFVAGATWVAMLPHGPSDRGPGVAIDAQGHVISVAEDSAAWDVGVRPGWVLLVQTEGSSTYEHDGRLRPVPDDSSGPDAQGYGRLVPSAAALLAGGALMLLGLWRTGTTLAIAGAALGAPAYADRLGVAGTIAAYVPVALAAVFVWGMARAVSLRPALAGRAAVAVALVALAAVPLIVLVSGGALLGWGGAAVAVTGYYLVVAWAMALRWRVALAAAGTPTPSRLAIARTVAIDMVPFADRMRRRGAQAERDRLASEMHAELLPAIASTAAALEKRGATDEAERLRGLAASVRDLVSERRLPILEDAGLVAAAEWLAELLESHAPITVELDLHGDAGVRLPGNVERAAYRVLQLALDNVIRHAGASIARIEIATGPRSLRLVVSDDGRGIDSGDAPKARHAGHLGLVDMRAEAASIGAVLEIGARPAQGTTVSLRWPA